MRVAPALPLRIGLLSMSLERLDMSAATYPTENPSDPAAVAEHHHQIWRCRCHQRCWIRRQRTAVAETENPGDPAAMAASPLTEMALSLSSVGMGVLVVRTATGAENNRDPAVRASSLPNVTVVPLSSETVGAPAVVEGAAGGTLLLTDVVSLSLSVCLSP